MDTELLIDNNGLTYVTLDVTEIYRLDFNEILQTSPETLRKSIDGTRTIVKWPTSYSVPECIQSLQTKGPYLTYEEALQLMSTSEWTIPWQGT